MCHIVTKVSPRFWGRMTEASAAYIDMQRVRVEDQSSLVQCSGCLGYGHSKRLCEEKEKGKMCGHCGGTHAPSGASGMQC